jgi:hypothetical protein
MNSGVFFFYSAIKFEWRIHFAASASLRRSSRVIVQWVIPACVPVLEVVLQRDERLRRFP